MENFVWKDTIRINILVLRFAGLWPEGVEGYKLNYYTLYSLAVIFFMNANNAFQTAYICFIYTDLQALTAIFFVLVTDWLATLKIHCFIKNARILQRLMSDLEITEFQPRNDEQVDLVRPTLKTWKIVYQAYVAVTITAVLLYCLFPLVNGTFKEFRLPYWAWYPYDTKISPNYEFTYIYQVVSIAMLASVNINMDTLIAALMMYVAIQCDILSDNLKHVKNDEDSQFVKELEYHVTHHKMILRFARDINTFFNGIVLGQFFTSAAALALAMFQLTMVAPMSSEFISLLFYISSMTMQIFLYCWYGNELETRRALDRLMSLKIRLAGLGEESLEERITKEISQL
ncbi:hypothetical protein Zmor_007648 [Zophobas morio]|uniref:Odorant receptor n=1 Tax=Zophobas morio TaxID=2755281 RepID=A0AA38MPN3_9CUCU|nr:hypothetical protein Zmor_007648 [Zophobas morio]